MINEPIQLIGQNSQSEHNNEKSLPAICLPTNEALLRDNMQLLNALMEQSLRQLCARSIPLKQQIRA
jgi:hypothetical protein